MMNRRVGFPYRPSVEHLVEALKYKAKGGEMSVYPRIRPGDIVEIEDLYCGEGKEPWEVFSGSNEITELHIVDDWQQKSRVIYIVTKLRKIGQKNYCRGAIDGSWDGQGTVVECKGHEIVEMGTLTYEFRGDLSEAIGQPHYYMHEYHLSRHSLDQIGLESTDYVLCRVIKDLSKPCHVKKGKGKKCASSSANTIDDSSKKKAKKSHDVQGCSEESSMILEKSSSLLNEETEFPGIVFESCEKEPADCRENVPGCSLDHEQGLTLDDFPDTLFDSCEKEGPDSSGIRDLGCVFDCENVAGCSSYHEQVLTLDDFPDNLFGSCEKDAPSWAGVCDLRGVVDPDYCENVVGCSSDHEQVLTLDDISSLLFGNENNLENDHEAAEEEEMTMGENSDLLFGNQEDLDHCFSSEFDKVAFRLEPVL